MKHKTELIVKLEEKTNQMANVMRDMEKGCVSHSLTVVHRQCVILIMYRTSMVRCRAKQSLTERQAMDESIRKLNQMVIDKDNKK